MKIITNSKSTLKIRKTRIISNNIKAYFIIIYIIIYQILFIEFEPLLFCFIFNIMIKKHNKLQEIT